MTPNLVKPGFVEVLLMKSLFVPGTSLAGYIINILSPRLYLNFHDRFRLQIILLERKST
jgi:hypothetical protein